MTADVTLVRTARSRSPTPIAVAVSLALATLAATLSTPLAGQTAPTAQDETAQEAPAPETMAAGVELVPVPEPAAGRLDDAVREQLAAHAALVAALRARPETRAPDLAAAYGELGQIYLAYQIFPAASAALENAHRLAPEAAEWLYLRGYAEEQEGDFDAAAEAFRAQLELEPGDLAGRLRLAEVYLRQGELERSREVFAAILDDPGRASYDVGVAAARYGLGRLARLEGRFAAAAEHLEAVLAAQPEASIARYPLALAYRELGRTELARAELARRGQGPVRFPDPRIEDLARQVRGAVAYLYQGSLARRLGETDVALLAYRRAVELEPESVEARRELGLLLVDLGDRAAAREQFRAVIELEPENALARYNLGTLLLERAELAAASEHLRAAVDAAPEFQEAWLNLGIALARGDRRDDALIAVARALELDPNDAWARLVRAQILDRLGRADEALSELRRTIEIAPRSVPAYLRAAELLRRLGRDGEARSVLEAGLAAVPEAGELAHRLARLLAASADDRLRDGPRALALARQVAAARPTVPHLETLAMAFAELGRFDDAVRVQEQALAAARTSGRDLVRELEDRLERYRRGEPWRERADADI